LIFDFGYAALRRHVLRTEEEDKQLGKLDRLLRDSGPLDVEVIPDWMSQYEIKKSVPR
jgi:hypothetical protein